MNPISFQKNFNSESHLSPYLRCIEYICFHQVKVSFHYRKNNFSQIPEISTFSSKLQFEKMKIDFPLL